MHCICWQLAHQRRFPVLRSRPKITTVMQPVRPEVQPAHRSRVLYHPRFLFPPDSYNPMLDVPTHGLPELLQQFRAISPSLHVYRPGQINCEAPAALNKRHFQILLLLYLVPSGVAKPHS